jgi:hypothetical protein
VIKTSLRYVNRTLKIRVHHASGLRLNRRSNSIDMWEAVREKREKKSRMVTVDLRREVCVLSALFSGQSHLRMILLC